MKKFKFYFILLIATVSLFSCSKDETVTYEPPREYSVQYEADIKVIEEYLNTYYITVTNNPGKTDDQDVIMTKIPDGGTQPSIMSYLNSGTYPKLLSRNASMNGTTYKLYYLVLREGTGSSLCNVDGVLTSYRGDYLESIAATTTTALSISTTKFDEVKYPQTFFPLFTTQAIPLRGWSEILPQFKAGTYASNSDGTITYNDFGAGVMFLPSGFGYYDTGSGSIPSYAPLVFSFKLYEIQRLDQDGDGIPSYQEDLDGDGYMYDFSNLIKYPTPPTTNPDDSDKDGIPDFFDVDDDGDMYTTKLEITNAATGLVYPFASIPDCSGNFTDPARIKKHLDKNCH